MFYNKNLTLDDKVIDNFKFYRKIKKNRKLKWKRENS